MAMKNLNIFKEAIGDLFEAYYNSWLRYPLASIASLMITVGLIGWQEEWWSQLFSTEKDYFWASIILAGLVLFPMGISSALISRYRSYPVLWSALAVAITIVSYFWFSNTPWGYAEAGWLKLPPLLLVWLCGIMIPFGVLPDGKSTFIPFCRALFIRLLMSFAFSMALYAGLALAIASIQLLFDVSIDSDIFLNLYFVCIGLVFPGHLLTGLPWDSEDDSVRSGYPNIGLYLSRYLLIPFTTGYLIILYAYFIRQLLRQEWPQGWIGPLSIGLSMLALFTRYFATQMGDRVWNPFEKAVLRVIFPALVPVGVAIILAIYERVGFYGWTEGRWAGVLTGLWIALTGLYFTVRPNADLRHALYGMAFFVIINWTGPISGIRIALSSQVKQLNQWEDAHLDDLGTVKPWESLASDEQGELRELVAFFASRNYWEVLSEESRYWHAYRELRGGDEPMEKTWNAFNAQFSGRRPERSELDWACDGTVWIDQQDLKENNAQISFSHIERGRNEFKEWQLNWRFPPVIRYLPDGKDSDSELGAEIRELLEGKSLYRRYSKDSMPCLEHWVRDKGIRICFSRLNGYIEARDTVLYESYGWITIMGDSSQAD